MIMFRDLPTIDEYSVRVCVSTGLCLPPSPEGYVLRLERVGGRGECVVPQASGGCSPCNPCVRVVYEPAPAPTDDVAVSLQIVESDAMGRLCALLPTPLTARLKSGMYQATLIKDDTEVARCGWFRVQPQKIAMHGSVDQGAACIEDCAALVECDSAYAPAAVPGPESRPLWS